MAPVSAIQSDPVGSGERGGLLACPANSARFAVVVEGLESEVDAAGALEEDASTAAFAFCLLLLLADVILLTQTIWSESLNCSNTNTLCKCL